MANVRNGNTWYVDTSSSAGTASTFITERNLKLIGCIYMLDATSDIIAIYDKSATSSAAGNQKLNIRSTTARQTQQILFYECPLVFPNGVWVTLTGSPVCTLVFTQAVAS